MHVIILGCGRVGSSLAGRLDAEGNSVAIIDKKPIPASLEAHARRACAACPTLALVLEQDAKTRV